MNKLLERSAELRSEGYDQVSFNNGHNGEYSMRFQKMNKTQKEHIKVTLVNGELQEVSDQNFLKEE